MRRNLIKNNKYTYIIALCIGVATVIISIATDILFPQLVENLGAFRWIFTGVGAGLIGAATSKIINTQLYKTNPELAKQARINETDERYIQVRKTAAYYMWHITMLLLCISSLIFVILNLTMAIWISLGVLAIHILLYFALLVKINKKI